MNDDLYDVVKEAYTRGTAPLALGDPIRTKEAIAQMHQMRDNGQKWLRENPNAKVQIAFKKIHGHQVIAAIDDALDAKIVVTNPDGLALIKALWPIHAYDAPTITMTRVVVEDLTR